MIKGNYMVTLELAKSYECNDLVWEFENKFKEGEDISRGEFMDFFLDWDCSEDEIEENWEKLKNSLLR